MDDLAGKPVPAVHPGNFDLSYGFTLPGKAADIVAVNLRDAPGLAVFRVDPDTGRLERADDGSVRTGPS